MTPARRAFAEALELDPDRIVVAGAVHGAEVARVDEPVGVVRGVDVVVTDRPGLGLLATFADCYPILLYDPGRRALALAHAGWRGCLAGVAGRAAEAMRREFDSMPHELVAGIGPGICGGCYEVSQDVAARFAPVHSRGSSAGRCMLDLAAANRDQLVAAGVLPDRIHVHGGCTRETPSLQSHRLFQDGVRFACISEIA